MSFEAASVTCPTLTYSSNTGDVYVPAPTASGFNGPVTFTYTSIGSPGTPITLVNPSAPFHQLQNVPAGQQLLTVTATDGINVATCVVQVYAFDRRFHFLFASFYTTVEKYCCLNG